MKFYVIYYNPDLNMQTPTISDRIVEEVGVKMVKIILGEAFKAHSVLEESEWKKMLSSGDFSLCCNTLAS